ncbi:MAG: tetratricopeptide repeat protein, partial [Acidobacteria bacterium]|nr:tetratricopeptide repeat protein [Acidobacteriota bacterium]
MPSRHSPCSKAARSPRSSWSTPAAGSKGSCIYTTSGARRWCSLGDSVPLLGALVALLVGLAAGKAWERYKLRDGRWIDRRRARDSHHYVLGLNFLVSNQIDLAIEELSQATRVDGDALEIHLILGNVHRERGQVARAIQIHQALLQRPKLTKVEHAYILLCLGLDFKRGGFVDRAVEAFNEVVRMDPNNQYALLYLQKLHEEQHQWADAHRIRKQLVALSGPDTQPRNQAILGFLENELGSEALGVGDRGRAARHFEEAIDLDAGTAPAFLNLGDVRLMQGDVAGAENAWDRLMTSSPERAYLAFGRLEKLYEQLGQPNKFETRCLRLVAANPQDWR